MRLINIALKALVMLCVVGAGIASVAVGTAYDTYDCEYFSVEYPSSWDVERSLAAEYEGWKYLFSHPDNSEVKHIRLIIGSDEIQFSSLTTLDEIVGGSLDASTQHFLDTLVFKTGDDVVTSQNITYELYDNVYFSVEYPSSWLAETIPFEEYDGQIYAFYDLDSDDVLAVTFGELSLNDILGLQINVRRISVGSGKFEEDVQHFIDTLHFKV
jgi:hypothetical protein